MHSPRREYNEHREYNEFYPKGNTSVKDFCRRKNEILNEKKIDEMKKLEVEKLKDLINRANRLKECDIKPPTLKKDIGDLEEALNDIYKYEENKADALNSFDWLHWNFGQINEAIEGSRDDNANTNDISNDLYSIMKDVKYLFGTIAFTTASSRLTAQESPSASTSDLTQTEKKRDTDNKRKDREERQERIRDDEGHISKSAKLEQNTIEGGEEKFTNILEKKRNIFLQQRGFGEFLSLTGEECNKIIHRLEEEGQEQQSKFFRLANQIRSQVEELSSMEGYRPEGMKIRSEKFKKQLDDYVNKPDEYGLGYAIVAQDVTITALDELIKKLKRNNSKQRKFYGF